jgi:phosphate transport system protein
MTEHISRQFDTEIEALRTGVLSMGGLVEKQFQRALIALGESDEDILDAVARDEQAINQAQMTIDHQCLQVIARRQPAAGDLRLVMTVTKIVNELERIGDELKKIAHKGPALRGHERLAQVRLHEIPRVAGIARDMLQMSLDAFARLDAAESADIVGLDAKVDAAFKAITRQLVSYMMEDPRTITAALEILFIAKWLERIGDHAKNIAEHVVQAAKGKDVRHASVEQIRMELNE